MWSMHMCTHTEVYSALVFLTQLGLGLCPDRKVTNSILGLPGQNNSPGRGGSMGPLNTDLCTVQLRICTLQREQATLWSHSLPLYILYYERQLKVNGGHARVEYWAPQQFTWIEEFAASTGAYVDAINASSTRIIPVMAWRHWTVCRSSRLGRPGPPHVVLSERQATCWRLFLIFNSGPACSSLTLFLFLIWIHIVCSLRILKVFIWFIDWNPYALSLNPWRPTIDSPNCTEVWLDLSLTRPMPELLKSEWPKSISD